MSRWTIEGDYQADGAVCVRQAFTAEHVALAREAIDENLADLSPRAKRASADGDGAFIEDFCNWTRLPAMERFIRESPGAEIAAELTGSDAIRLYHDHMPRTFLDDQAKWFPDGSLAELPDFAADPDRWRVLGWELEPGDAVFFDMLTVHGSGGVSGTNRRRVVSVRYLGDDMVHAPRRWTTSPPFDGLDAELDAGAAMDHPLFPTLWTRPAARENAAR